MNMIFMFSSCKIPITTPVFGFLSPHLVFPIWIQGSPLSGIRKGKQVRNQISGLAPEGSLHLDLAFGIGPDVGEFTVYPLWNPGWSSGATSLAVEIKEPGAV